MSRYVLTGAPGAGKTTLLRLLQSVGHTVVEEAATDVIAIEHARGVDEPWATAAFIDEIIAVQREREQKAVGALQFFDRSPVCTYALCQFLGFAPTAALSEELARIARERTYEKQVFFIQNLGFITPTAARRISFEDALRFEQAQVEAYMSLGYALTFIPPGEPLRRVAMITDALR